MGDSWSYAPHDRYKPARALVHTLVNIVAKGGNLLLGIGPDATGQLPAESVKRLEEIGAWLSVNGRAIYATRAIPPYSDGNFRFTREAGGAVDAIYLPPDGADAPPAGMTVHAFAPAKGSAVRLIGAPGTVAWHADGKGFTITLTDEQRAHLPCAYAWTFRIDQPEKR